MGNSVTFRLNPKHAEDRAIIEWLDANAGTEGGQTALVKAALLSVIQENNESGWSSWQQKYACPYCAKFRKEIRRKKGTVAL